MSCYKKLRIDFNATDDTGKKKKDSSCSAKRLRLYCAIYTFSLSFTWLLSRGSAKESAPEECWSSWLCYVLLPLLRHRVDSSSSLIYFRKGISSLLWTLFCRSWWRRSYLELWSLSFSSETISARENQKWHPSPSRSSNLSRRNHRIRLRPSPRNFTLTAQIRYGMMHSVEFWHDFIRIDPALLQLYWAGNEILMLEMVWYIDAVLINVIVGLNRLMTIYFLVKWEMLNLLHFSCM